MRQGFFSFLGPGVVGPELFTNGDFSSATGWSVGAPWAIAAGVATIDGSQGANAYLYQNGLIESGRLYRFEITVSLLVDGVLTLQAGNTGGGDSITTNGTHVQYLIGGGNLDAILRANIDLDCTVDNASLKKVL